MRRGRRPSMFAIRWEADTWETQKTGGIRVLKSDVVSVIQLKYNIQFKKY